MSSDTGIDWMRDLVRAAPSDGLFMEFGVASGATIRRLANFVPDRTFYGFDSFDGLPEEWTGRGGMAKGSFRCEEPTDLPPNVKIVKGLFHDTLPKFLASHPQRASFIHVDCDLYSSTMVVLMLLSDRLDGAVVAFDEICGPECYETHEGAALRDFLMESGYSVELLGSQHECGRVFRFNA